MATDPTALEACYRLVSPQLLARVRQLWSARGLDLDRAWRGAIPTLPGFGAGPAGPAPQDSRPVDLLLLFDQATIWLHGLQIGTGCTLRGAGHRRRVELSDDQLHSLQAILARLREEIAAVRLLVLVGLATPAMQIIRSISEDVDMALVMLLRPKVAQQFASCRSPQEAGEFWKRHIAGGRAFRAVAEQLYRVGLDFGADSSYARWRGEVQMLLGAAVHTSYLGGGGPTGPAAALGPAAQECLQFATLRLQEMCVYSLMLGEPLRRDLAAGAAGADPDERAMIAVALDGSEIIIDQMRWLTGLAESLS